MKGREKENDAQESGEKRVSGQERDEERKNKERKKERKKQ